MPDAAGTKNDGGMVFGSQVLTIPNVDALDTDYIAESFSLKAPSSWTVSQDANGVPNKQFGRREVRTGSAALQLEDNTTKLPLLFAEFTATEVGGSTVTLIVSDVGEAFDQNGETKVSIEVREKLSS